MKTSLLSILFIIFNSLNCDSQSSDKIFLEWKIAKNDTLTFQTLMNPSKTEEKVNDSITKLIDDQLSFFKKYLSEINSSYKYETNLVLNSKNKNQIDIDMKMIKKEEPIINEEILIEEAIINDSNSKKKSKKKKKKDLEEEETEFNFNSGFSEMLKLNNNVVLRGRISTSGEILSDYYKGSQKNLIAMLFELPNKEIIVGEKWKLDINLIEMDQNFYCDSMSSLNSVYIEKIIEKEGDRIAVIKYEILEYVIGEFNNPFVQNSEKTKTFMKATHNAIGYFSIDKGKWISYEGKMEIETNFSFLAGKSTTEFILIE